jgi:epidermal growth factor receptor substrate 15
MSWQSQIESGQTHQQVFSEKPHSSPMSSHGEEPSGWSFGQSEASGNGDGRQTSPKVLKPVSHTVPGQQVSHTPSSHGSQSAVHSVAVVVSVSVSASESESMSESVSLSVSVSESVSESESVSVSVSSSPEELLLWHAGSASAANSASRQRCFTKGPPLG